MKRKLPLLNKENTEFEYLFKINNCEIHSSGAELRAIMLSEQLKWTHSQKEVSSLAARASCIRVPPKCFSFSIFRCNSMLRSDEFLSSFEEEIKKKLFKPRSFITWRIYQFFGILISLKTAKRSELRLAKLKARSEASRQK